MEKVKKGWFLMVAKIKMIFRLFYIHAKLDILWFLRDTKYCLLTMAADIISAVASAGGIWLLAARFDGIGGMTQTEILFMQGYALLVNGIYCLFFINQNIGQISRVVGRGQLDHNMIQPVPLWIQILTSGFAPASGSATLICGIAITGYALVKLKIGLSLVWGLTLVISAVASSAVLLSVVYIVSCLAFYAPAAAEEISGPAYEMMRSLRSYPLGGLSTAITTLFCTVIPVGLAAWFPSLVLLKKTPELFGEIRFPAFTVAIATIFILITILLFKKGMKYYAKYGSPRYSGFGHR